MIETEGKDMESLKETIRISLSRWSAITALSLNYAGVILLMIFWPLGPIQFMLLIFGLSLLTGALLVDLEKTILYSTLGLVIGIVIAVGIFLAPYDLFGESSDVISAATIVVFSHVAKHLLIGISPFIIGLIFGCLIGDRFE